MRTDMETLLSLLALGEGLTASDCAPSPKMRGEQLLPVVLALLDAGAEIVAEKVARRMGAAPAPRYADAKHNPLGSARAFLDAARRGAFTSFKRGRHVAARWEDVEAYIEARTRTSRRRAPDGLDGDRALLAAHGVRLRRSEHR